ncbi:MAG TPA: sigma-70 family RNA polymerase sigma factor, partial [Tepidisphaeraceae bacterium]|nr:sigma-70 family RNA polymerase sigma factor [Tepidisphaeraceae bacterium]
MTDVELVEQHRAGGQSAFAEIVSRHAGWVYGMARRRLRDGQTAEDVTQAVFVLLHRKLPRFEADGALINWLHRAAWYATETTIRNQRRRQMRESEAATMRATTTDPAENEQWEELAPMLDRLIGRL